MVLRIVVAFGIGSCGFLSYSQAGHFDIVPYATGTAAGSQLLTGGHNDLDSITSQLVEVFGYDFGETDPYFAGDPGINNTSSFTNGVFPNDGKMPAGTLVLSIFSGSYGPLHYWNGVGEPLFLPVSDGIEINLNRNSSNLRVGAATTSGSLNVATVPSAGGSAGRVHVHLTSSIGTGGSGSSFSTLGAPDGLYAFGATLSVGGLTSDPIYFVFNQGMSEAVHDDGMAFYQAHVVPEPSSVALAGLGVAGALAAGWRRRRRAAARNSEVADIAR
jgi:hypothetical protein